jgi:hypothetical protein
MTLLSGTPGCRSDANTPASPANFLRNDRAARADISVSDRVCVLVLSEDEHVRQVVGRVLRWNRYHVVEVGSPREAILAALCDVALVDVPGEMKIRTRLPATSASPGLARRILFFDGT